MTTLRAILGYAIVQNPCDDASERGPRVCHRVESVR